MYFAVSAGSKPSPCSSHYLLTCRTLAVAYSAGAKDGSVDANSLRHSIPSLACGSSGIRTVRATKDSPIVLDAMTDYTTGTMMASRGERLDCALKAVERVLLSGLKYFEGLIVIVAAYFTDCHVQFSRASRYCRFQPASVL